MEKTKRCPYCGEEILAIAKKCKHCGEWLDETHPLKETKKRSCLWRIYCCRCKSMSYMQ